MYLLFRVAIRWVANLAVYQEPFWQTANTAATTITDFDDPKGDLHKITILFTDTNTTIQNNANIVIQSGSDFTGAVDDVKVFLYDGTNWVEQAIDSGAIDHGGLIGLADDDHTQYLLADGSRALTGDWDIGDGRKINADKIQARDGDGLELFNDDDRGIRITDADGGIFLDTGSVINDVDFGVNIGPSLGTNSAGLWIRKALEVQTTDAVQTDMDTIVSLVADSCYHFEAFITAIQSDGSDRASYHIAATVYRDGGANAAFQGAVQTLYSSESNAALDATFTLPGATSVVVSVTGIAAETWQWSAIAMYMNVFV
jgi:hypothetical protein